MKKMWMMAAAVPAMLLAAVGFSKQGQASEGDFSPDQAAWEVAASEGDANALQAFIAAYPQSNFVTEAVDRLIEIEVADYDPSASGAPGGNDPGQGGGTGTDKY